MAPRSDLDRQPAPTPRTDAGGDPTERASLAGPKTALVVGAGLAGLACARALADAGLGVTVVEKSRGAGGRMATRRHDALRFDHGAQFFSARDPRFLGFVESWHHEGVVAPWRGQLVTLVGEDVHAAPADRRWVGTPGMSAIARHLARGLDVRFADRVEALAWGRGGVEATLSSGTVLRAGRCLLSPPVPQTLDLLGPGHPIAQALGPVVLSPCIALMVAWDAPLGLGFDAAFVEGDGRTLQWVARNDSKPGRPAGAQWVLHASTAWSERHVEHDPETLAPTLLDAFARTVGRALPTPSFVRVHRWRYARVERPLAVDHLYDPASGVGYCGDACGGSRVESAFSSGLALADRVLGTTAADPLPEVGAPSTRPIPDV